MSSHSSPSFPVSILQSGVKMTVEPLPGVRANMQRTLTLDLTASDAFFDGATAPLPFKRLLFSLVFFHAIVQERRRFGPLGWNVPYDFDDDEWRLSARQLLEFVNVSEGAPPLDALRFVTGECNYGCAVADDRDRRLVCTLLERSYAAALLQSDSYSLSESGLFKCDWGAGASRADMLHALTALPMAPLPEAFGLHANADIAKDASATTAFLAALLRAGGVATGGGGGAEAHATAAITASMQQLPADFDVESAARKYPYLYEEAMNTVRCLFFFLAL
jgi:dynein heavy chain, axonemal